ncbi:MAG: lysine biosynthesis protein LysW [Candidatus Levybacteria bacterium]|nr:lysine biosynthesis protein LysW [Candidatus Levybacteria bacterium]
MQLTSQCIVCDADVQLPKDVQISEIVSCLECKTNLVVERINEMKIALSKAPAVEEDWGE